MANVRHYRIILSRAHSPVYQSGEAVRGLVSFDVEDAQGIQALRVIVRGETEEIFNWSAGLLGSGSAPHAALLRPEHHSHPFVFTLPVKCPSTYTNENVRITYSIKAELYPTDGWQERKDFWLSLTVVSPIDINLSKYLAPVAVSDRTTSDCCAQPYKYTSLDIRCDRGVGSAAFLLSLLR
ncbi:hypothetical protein RvY_15320-2 [Ramazzottius varieornatus]|uniref:Arrestin-like N-terminal domain-containing protein n=1 Tax=Ramazzottius varieornatus TaxID=947166 RepID=A0A1D1VW34_RAMVA|nr:hypothetical protein RvY_15320-2 [Ramazzottius varieornatus]